MTLQRDWTKDSAARYSLEEVLACGVRRTVAVLQLINADRWSVYRVDVGVARDFRAVYSEDGQPPFAAALSTLTAEG